MAEKEKLALRIIAPDKMLYDGDADYVSYPIDGGDRGVLPGHTRLIATVGKGEVRVKNDKGEQSFPVSGGLIKINHHHVSLLVS